MYIYADILFAENFIINYLILFVSAKLLKLSIYPLRLILSAAFGAAYAIIMLLFPSMSIYCSFPAKILLSVAMSALALKPNGLIQHLKCISAFYVCTFIFAGMTFAFAVFQNTDGLIANAVSPLYSYSFKIIFCVVGTAVILIVSLAFIFKPLIVRQRHLISVKVFLGDAVSDLCALVDTGNSLTDPVSLKPVIVAELRAMTSLLPSDINAIFSSGEHMDYNLVSKGLSLCEHPEKFRMIPYSAVGSDGMLLGVRADKIEFDEGSGLKSCEDIVICLYNSTISKKGDYNSLMNPSLL